ncbi:hypothetical protein SprV_0401469400 [Sparganum proliferum]
MEATTPRLTKKLRPNRHLDLDAHYEGLRLRLTARCPNDASTAANLATRSPIDPSSPPAQGSADNLLYDPTTACVLTCRIGDSDDSTFVGSVCAIATVVVVEEEEEEEEEEEGVRQTLHKSSTIIN